MVKLLCSTMGSNRDFCASVCPYTGTCICAQSIFLCTVFGLGDSVVHVLSFHAPFSSSLPNFALFPQYHLAHSFLLIPHIFPHHILPVRVNLEELLHCRMLQIMH